MGSGILCPFAPAVTGRAPAGAPSRAVAESADGPSRPRRL